MRERPILFSAPMVRAILHGRKTQTRRVVKLPKELSAGSLSRAWPDKLFGVTPGLQVPMPDESMQRLRNPWGWPEPSRLWLKEAWRTTKSLDHLMPSQIAPRPGIQYEAGGTSFGANRLEGAGRYRAARFMPRWVSRITLQITDVRVELLNDISEADAIAEGIERISGETSVTPWRNYNKPENAVFCCHCAAPSASYRSLWEFITGPGSWEINPWVWVIEFRQVDPLTQSGPNE